MPSKVRVRFAPSPTGPLHIGGIRSALFNYLFAKKHQGSFILRIEDTDQQRFVKHAEQHIVDSLHWCGLVPDESPFHGGALGPYRQSERKHIYQPYIEQLICSGSAYYAFDTAEELEKARKQALAKGKPAWQYDAFTRMEMRNSLVLSKSDTKNLLQKGAPYTIRIKIEPGKEISFHDLIRGDIKLQTSLLDDKVICKSDGMPTYHLAHVVDDHLMKISHVIRGEEWLPSTALHVLLYKCLGWEKTMPVFAHLPLILKPQGKGKLSKRDGEKMGFPVYPLQWRQEKTNERLSGFRETGFLPEAFVNMLALLGWNPGNEREIFSMDELIRAFSFQGVGKAGARFDYNRAVWFNEQHIRKKSVEELVELISPTLSSHIKLRDKTFLFKVVALMKERLSLINDFWDKASYFFIPPKAYDDKLLRKKWKQSFQLAMNDLISRLNDLSNFQSNEIELQFKLTVEQFQTGFGAFLLVLRLFITGKGKGPSLFHIMELIGKQESLTRIQRGQAHLKTFNNK